MGCERALTQKSLVWTDLVSMWWCTCCFATLLCVPFDPSWTLDHLTHCMAWLCTDFD